MDLLLYALATEHLSRVITKDSLTSVLRSPFTRFKEPAGEGEVNEDAIGTGARHAVGELFTCPFCMAQGVATESRHFGQRGCSCKRLPGSTLWTGPRRPTPP
jgi:hypothetical protein